MNFRALTGADYDLWKAIRLEALSNHPESYLTTYDEERARPRSESMDWLQSGAVLGAFDGNLLCAVLSVDAECHPSMAHRGWIHAVYCRPDWRGGVMDGLMRFAVGKARDDGLLQLELYVEAENARAIRFYERIGFEKAGRLPRAVHINGQFQDDLHYWLPL